MPIGIRRQRRLALVDLKKIDITMSTIVALIAPSREPTNLEQKDLEHILTPPLTIGQGMGGFIVSSQRDQIEVTALPNRIEVKDLSGHSDFAMRKVPTVLDVFVKAMSSKLATYGINFVLLIPCTKPETWIIDNILARNISEKTGKTLLGGGVTLKVSAGEKTWTVNLTPAENDHMTVNFNISQNTEQLPYEETLKSEMVEHFEALISFLNQLGL